MRQLVLDLPHGPGFGRDDFLAGRSNEEALRLVEAWPDWPDPVLLLEGPPGSGKSHLAAIWAVRSGATAVAAADLGMGAVPDLADAPALVVEDLDRGPLDEAALFHLLNLARERDRSILFTSGRPVAELGIGTRDLASRLRLAPSGHLGWPDDALLRAVLVKLFHDRQLVVDITVIEYVAKRIERSLGRAAAVVAELDRETLSQGRRVTRSAAAALLGAEGPAGDDGG